MNLQVIDVETGEVPSACPTCQVLKDQLRGAEREIRAWRTRCAKLEVDATAGVKDDPLWQEAVGLFDYWRRKTKHPRSKFTAERFLLARPYLERDGLDFCKRAVDGAAFDPFVTRRRNGTVKRHDSWELVFRDRGRFEEWVNKAPLRSEVEARQ